LEHDDPMDEHRIANRQRVLKAGKIEFGGGAIDCTVRNISATGAALEVTSPLGIPEQFTLVTGGNLCPAGSFGAKKSESASPSIKSRKGALRSAGAEIFGMLAAPAPANTRATRISG
jgi:hypothetical protein